MPLDPRTVVVLTALASLLMGGAMLLAARSYRGAADGMRSWALACAVQSVAWLLVALRDRLPDFLSVVVGNTSFVLATALFYQALREFRGQPFRKAAPFMLVAATFFALLPFTDLGGSVAIRLLIVTAALVALTCACAFELLRGVRAAPLSRWLTGLGFAVACVALPGRAVYLLIVDPELAAGFEPDPVQIMTFVGNFALTVLLTFGFVLMRSDRFHADLHRLATLDSLTECLNRAAFEKQLRAEISRAQRAGEPLSLLMLDLDHFKRVNDTHGHLAGDAALRAVAARLRNQLRLSDSIGRYGGEEFAVLLPGASADQGRLVAERVRGAIVAEPIQVRGGALPLTVSVGVASFEPGDDLETLLNRADDALYAAKAAGRDRVEIAQPSAGGGPGAPAPPVG